MADSDGGHIWPPRASDLRIQAITGAGPEGSTPDDLHRIFRAAGYTGSLDDMWKQHLAAKGVTDTSEPFTDDLSFGATDPEFANVQFLIPLDGSVAEDVSNNGYTVTKGVNSIYDTLNVNVNETSCLQSSNSASNGLLLTPTVGTMDLGADDWTLEMWWMRLAGQGSGDHWFDFIDFTNNWGMSSTVSSGVSFRYYHSGGTLRNIFTGQNPPQDEWRHMVWQRRSDVFELYFSGTLAYSTAMTETLDPIGSPTVFSIGTQDNFSNAIPGRWEQIRFTKGVARYEPGYTVPTAPFPQA